MEKKLRFYTKQRLSPSFFNKLYRKFSLTNWLIIINIAVFVLSLFLILIFGQEKALSYIGLQPNNFISGTYPWTLITSMFVHGGFGHLFVNMVSLFFIGNFIEKLIGRKRYFWLYILSGLIAGLFFVFFSYFFGNSYWGAKIFGSPEIYAVGASGAIFALGGLLAILTPNLRVYVFFFIPMKMRDAMIFLLGVLWLLSVLGDLPIGNSAHFGGLVVGLGYGFYLKIKYKRKTEMIKKYFS